MFRSLILCKGHISKTCHSNVSYNPSSKTNTSDKIGKMSTIDLQRGKIRKGAEKGDDQCAPQKGKMKAIASFL